MAITPYQVGDGIRSTGGPAAATTYGDTAYEMPQRDGLDLLWSQQYLATQTQQIEEEIIAIEANANLSDTERMFAMQTAMNTWSSVTNLRTNVLKAVSDTLKAVVRNVN